MTYLLCLTTFAPILISFTRRLRSDQCFIFLLRKKSAVRCHLCTMKLKLNSSIKTNFHAFTLQVIRISQILSNVIYYIIRCYGKLWKLLLGLIWGIRVKLLLFILTYRPALDSSLPGSHGFFTTLLNKRASALCLVPFIIILYLCSSVVCFFLFVTYYHLFLPDYFWAYIKK